MNIRKINGDDPLLKEEYLNIPVSEIKSLYRKIITCYHTYLEDYGVKKLWKEESPLDMDDDAFIATLDAKMLQLIFLYKLLLEILLHLQLLERYIHLMNLLMLV